MDKQRAAVEMFNSGCNCSQAILSVFAEEYGLSKDMALRIASGFGGGLGSTGNVCGALTGACMVLGLAFGPSEPGDNSRKKQTYHKVGILTQEFKMRTGSLLCRDLLGFDLGTTEGRLDAVQARAFDKCDEFVRVAAEILEEMLK